MYRKLLIGALVGGVVAVTVASVALASPRRPGRPTQLTLWHNYGTEGNAVATKNLVTAFEKANPDITIKVVSQPADNYFALLQSVGDLAHRRPTSPSMWTGLFDLKYAEVPAQPEAVLLGRRDRQDQRRRSYMAPDFNTSKGLLVMPLENQFYIGFYNKALFAKAGIAGPPTELERALRRLHEAQGQGHHADGLRRRHAGPRRRRSTRSTTSATRCRASSRRRSGRASTRARRRGRRPRSSSQMTKWAALQDEGLHEPGRAHEVQHPRHVRRAARPP